MPDRADPARQVGPVRPLADESARRTAREELDRNVFVEAGAGSGKTTLLVERVVALVAAGTPVERIAAITFTERAALELTERLRHAFGERRADDPDGRWARAYDGLDAAAIGTLHSFARSILADFSLLAGLPPSFDVADDARSAQAFDRRWRRFAARLLREPDDPADRPAAELARGVRLALATGVTTTNLRQLTKALDESWDLAAERIGGEPRPVPVLPIDGVLAELEAVVALGDHCRNDEDKLFRLLAQLGRLAEALRAQPDEPGRLAALRPLADVKTGSKGLANNWTRAPGGKPGVIGRIGALRDRVDHEVASAQQAALDHLAGAVAAEVALAAAQRRRTGELEFHDLLVLTRDLLRDRGHGQRVRAALHERFRQLLLDEFQDTDPIQLEIAVLIAADPAAPPDPLPAPRPGRLFFVGDPKQSIYRFRRADVGTYLDARQRYGDPVVELKVNFRSTRGVIDWVNKVFRAVISERDGSQAAYRALVPVRATVAGPSVLTLGGEHTDGPDADTLRAREAADVAQAVASAIGNWHVDDGAGGGRPARASDVAILIPTRAVLPALEDALAGAEVPARVEAGSLLFGGNEVAELLTVARAAVLPADELSVLAALRTTLLGVSEVDLYRHRVPHRASLDPCDEHDAAGTPVEQALAELGRWHALATWASPSVVLGTILDECRGWELAGHDTRPRDAMRRLRVLVDQARAFADDAGGTMADWLGWIDRQHSDGARLAEPLVPEPDDEAVRILTIHAAKGLEFPIVVVAGLTGRPGGRPQSTRVLWPAGGGPPEIKLAKGLTSASYDEAADLDAQLDDDERRRLLYVACTRARDHLILSLHHSTERRGGESLAALAAQHGAADHGSQPFDQPALPLGLRPQAPVDPPERAWCPPTLAPSSVVSATAVAAAAGGDHAGGAAWPGIVDEADPTARAAASGAATAFGLAVHAVLERIPFDALDRAGGRASIEAAAADAAALEGIDERADEIVRAVAVTLATPIVRAAAVGPHWREMYVAAPLGERLVEGYIDLLVRTDRGLALVDYKTDARPPADGGVDPHHRVQLAVYAHALEHALGETVVDAYLVYCRDEADAQRAVPDLAAAVAQLRAASAGGSIVASGGAPADGRDVP